MLDGVSAKFNPFVVLNILWVLTLIFSSILLASSAERVAVMLLAVDSVSFFASPIAFWVSRIRSLRNLLEASSATQPDQRRSYTRLTQRAKGDATKTDRLNARMAESYQIRRLPCWTRRKLGTEYWIPKINDKQKQK